MQQHCIICFSCLLAILPFELYFVLFLLFALDFCATLHYILFALAFCATLHHTFLHQTFVQQHSIICLSCLLVAAAVYLCLSPLCTPPSQASDDFIQTYICCRSLDAPHVVFACLLCTPPSHALDDFINQERYLAYTANLEAVYGNDVCLHSLLLSSELHLASLQMIPSICSTSHLKMPPQSRLASKLLGLR